MTLGETYGKTLTQKKIVLYYIMKYGKVLTHAIIIGLLLAILYQLARPASYYVPHVMEPQDISIKGTGRDPRQLGDIKPSLACVPGPQKEAAYYTMGMTPGGLCGDEDFVLSQMRDYSIANGIGGSLLDRT
jgi:hypothetical protein